jgi:hypothetical protein
MSNLTQPISLQAFADKMRDRINIACDADENIQLAHYVAIAQDITSLINSRFETRNTSFHVEDDSRIINLRTFNSLLSAIYSIRRLLDRASTNDDNLANIYKQLTIPIVSGKEEDEFKFEQIKIYGGLTSTFYTRGYILSEDEFEKVGSDYTSFFHRDTELVYYAYCEDLDEYHLAEDTMYLEFYEHYVHYQNSDIVETYDGQHIYQNDAIMVHDRNFDEVYIHEDEDHIYTNDYRYLNEEAAEANDCWYDDNFDEWREDNERTDDLYFSNPFAASEMRRYKQSLSQIEYTALEHTIGITSITNRQFNGMKYTFGVEIETHDISNNFCAASLKLNVASVSDGSISGAEYVTGPMTGDTGLNNVKSLCKTLNTNGATVNNKCGIHVHIGGAQFNRRFQILSIMLGMQIQDEMFAMQPESRQSNTYCKRIPDRYLMLKNCFKLDNNNRKQSLNYLHEYVTNNTREFNQDRNKKRSHPNGHYCSSRYKWLNLNNCAFSSGPETVEFRLQSGTTEFEKIKYFVQICMAFVNFVENKSRRIHLGLQHYYDYKKRNTMVLGNSVSLREVIEYSYSTDQAAEIINYVKLRTDIFLK